MRAAVVLRAATANAASIEARLWNWARKRLGEETCSLELHEENAAFIDSIHAAGRVLRGMYPFISTLVQFRARMKGVPVPPGLEGPATLTTWNSAAGFVEGAEQAHRALLDAHWEHRRESIPEPLRESVSPEVLRWLEGSENEITAQNPRVIAVNARVQSFGGPESLRIVREQSSPFGVFKNPDSMAVFHHDTWTGSRLKLEVATVAEAECTPAQGSGSDTNVLRRLDRLHMACDFNLREGIASEFRISKLEELLSEIRSKSWFADDDDAVE